MRIHFKWGEGGGRTKKYDVGQEFGLKREVSNLPRRPIVNNGGPPRGRCARWGTL